MNSNTEINPHRYKEEILTLLASNQKRDATEELAQLIQKKNFFYSTRNDEKSECWVYEEGIFVAQGKSTIKEWCRKLLGKAYTGHLANEVIAKIEADTYIDSEEFFNNNYPEEIAITNGILNIRTRELTGFTPDKIFFSKLPVEYSPDADCPTIKKHLQTVLKNEEDLPVMQELFGYLLLKEYRIEKAFMLLGNGRNGKGKTIEIMKRFLGPENCTNIPLQQLESDQFALGDLFQKMANLSGDIDSRALKYTGTFKSVTGRDLLAAQRKFLTRINFVNYAKMIFLANQLPETRDLTRAFWDRWVLLEFPYTFVSEKEFKKSEEKEGLKIADPEIVKKLTTKEELSGLLNWALDGLGRLLEQKDFSYSKSSQEVKTMWIRKSDSFSAFCMDCIEENYKCRIAKSELRRAYSVYCNRHKLKMANDQQIKEVLSTTYGVSEGRDRREGDNLYSWTGIHFKKEVEASQDDTGFSTYINFLGA